MAECPLQGTQDLKLEPSALQSGYERFDLDTDQVTGIQYLVQFECLLRDLVTANINLYLDAILLEVCKPRFFLGAFWWSGGHKCIPGMTRVPVSPHQEGHIFYATDQSYGLHRTCGGNAENRVFQFLQSCRSAAERCDLLGTMRRLRFRMWNFHCMQAGMNRLSSNPSSP